MRPSASISPFIVAAGLQTGLLLLIRERMQAALHGVDRAGRDLTMLRAILLRLETEQLREPAARGARREAPPRGRTRGAA